MPFNTLTAGAAVAPTALSTLFLHYTNRKSLHEKPTAHISYHAGLNVIRKFLFYASHHTVEELQTFTGQKVTTPYWVRVTEETVPPQYLTAAANSVIDELRPDGVRRVGGKHWWQWRGGVPLRGEWIETKKDYQERKDSGVRSCRAILYIHGGAYFFGSVDAHRYQMQRHARKLGARVFARFLTTHYKLAKYRLAPQFPFPCGLQDCIAAYLYLLTIQDPSEIILSGDSAGAGMVVSVLVTLRDQGLPLPAGGILLSPWVDLLHSFPSVGGDASMDFIPPHGFMQRPSIAWPPPNADELSVILDNVRRRSGRPHPPVARAMPQSPGELATAIQGFSVHESGVSPTNTSEQTHGYSRLNIPTAGPPLTTRVNGKVVEIKDQVQMYTTNQLLSHPLVSPIFQPTLGGLPPLLVLTGGGELLRDEQIYIAHKAADPASYPPSEECLNHYDPTREAIPKYKPTYVQLQVWDDLCHIAATLSFTRPAKHMFRSIAQFGAWALARAQGCEIEIPNNEDVNLLPPDGPSNPHDKHGKSAMKPGLTCVGQAGDPLPQFHKHMVRQRVDRHGRIYPLADRSSFTALQIPPQQVGAVNSDPLRKWMAAKQLWDTRYAKEKLQVQEQRIEELLIGIEQFGDNEYPPPSSLAARKGIRTRVSMERRRNRGMTLWSRWASKDDIKALGRDSTRKISPETISPGNRGGAEATRPSMRSEERSRYSQTAAQRRSLSGRRTVTDSGQADDRLQDKSDPDDSDARFNFLLTTPSATSDEHIYHPGIPRADGPGPSGSRRSEYRLSGGIMSDIGEKKQLSPNSNNEEASAATIVDAEGIIPPASESSSSRVDWRTPNEYNLSPQDTPSVYSQDTEGIPIPRNLSIPITKSGAGVDTYGRPKRRAYDFESVNLEPSDTEPFPPFPPSSGNPSFASRA